MNKFDRILFEALVKNNVLSEAEGKLYFSEAQSAGQLFKEYLLAQNIVTDKQVLISLSQHLNIDIIDLNKTSVDQSVIDRVPVKFAWYYKIIPVQIDKNKLGIVSAAPLDVKVQDEIRMHLGFSEIESFLASENELMEAFKKYYGFASETIDRIMTKEPIKEVAASASDMDQWIEDLERQTDDPTVSNLVNQIILEAYKKRATDIHIEPYRDKVRFRYRIDGMLTDAKLPANVKHFLPAILSRIKILANLSITEKRLPQDGSAVVKTKEQQLDLRISTMPTPRGESMVIRILPTKVRLLSLESLGFDERSVGIFRKLITKPHGIIFITGPTGSGKTTTLYAGLNEINATERKIVTIEDPVEYEMDGVTQVQVNPKLGFTFSIGLRSILRHDPDIIMVGEVRDLETAEIAIRTALTGHLVFSTLHTNDASSGITRLIDMGVEPYLVASSVEAFVAQRLVRVICPNCKEEVTNPPEMIRDEIMGSLKLTSPDTIKIWHGKGCDHCNQTGYYGRVAIYELLLMNDIIRAAILEKPRSNYIKKVAMSCGLITLRQNGWSAVLKGITTLEEVMNVSIKDEYEDMLQQPLLSSTEKDAQGREGKDNNFVTVRKKGIWTTRQEAEARSHPRVSAAVRMRYRMLKRDPKDPNFLLSDGVEHPTVTEDISAAGLRFRSKVLIPIGTILELTIQFDGTDRSINCLGKVCRLEEDNRDKMFTIVTYYLDISSADKAVINKFVEKRLQSIKM